MVIYFETKKRKCENKSKIFLLNKIRFLVGGSGVDIVNQQAKNCDKMKTDSTNDVKYDIDNPVSVDFIEDFLFIGNATAACDAKTIDNLRIKYILTVDSCPLPTSVKDNPKLVCKYIQAVDSPREDLLQHFEECITFIESAVGSHQNILVHCYYGVSRSATVAIAYLMKKHRFKFEQAFSLAKTKRKLVFPNPGFVQQLKLFYQMGFKIDKNNENYKMYRLKLAADKLQKAKIFPNDFLDLIKMDPDKAQENPDPRLFRCRRCRRVLAAQNQQFVHKPKPEEPKNEISSVELVKELTVMLESNHLSKSDDSDKSLPIGNEVAVCSKAFFFEPISWMTVAPNEILRHTQGNLQCPKCSTKLGHFNWVMAIKCPCGKRVQPGFYMMPSRVDKSNIVQNIQVTI